MRPATRTGVAPESLLLHRIRETGRFTARRVYNQVLEACEIGVRRGDIAGPRHYLGCLTASTYESLRYELYTDVELLARMLEVDAILGMPVAIGSLGTPVRAFAYAGVCVDVEDEHEPNRIILDERLVAASGMFTPKAPEDYPEDTVLVENTVSYPDLGVLYAGQRLCSPLTPGKVPHMLLAPPVTASLTPDNVLAVVLENIPENRFVGKLVERRRIPVLWVPARD